MSLGVVFGLAVGFARELKMQVAMRSGSGLSDPARVKLRFALLTSATTSSSKALGGSVILGTGGMFAQTRVMLEAKARAGTEKCKHVPASSIQRVY